MFTTAIQRIRSVIQSRLVREEKGATAVEYGLIVGLIAIVIIVGVGLLGTTLNGMFSDIAGELPAVGE